MIRGSNEINSNISSCNSIMDAASYYGNSQERLMGKGDKRRPCCTTKEERELRHRYATTKMTFLQYERVYRKLMKQGLIKRNGRVLK